MVIQMMTMLRVADNSGAKEVMCIHPLGKRKWGRIGDIFTGAVKSTIPGGKVKRGDVVRALIIRQRNKFIRPDGSELYFGENACVLMAKPAPPKKEHVPLGTRVAGPVPKFLRAKGFARVVSMATKLV